MKAVLSSFPFVLWSCFRTRASMNFEILALRHQLAVLQRRTTKRPSLRTADRLLWVVLSRLWARWRSALVIVKPETVIAWQRKSFRLLFVFIVLARQRRQVIHFNVTAHPRIKFRVSLSAAIVFQGV